MGKNTSFATQEIGEDDESGTGSGSEAESDEEVEGNPTVCPMVDAPTFTTS